MDRMNLVSVVATLSSCCAAEADLMLFFNHHVRPGVFERDPIYKLHVNEGLALVPAPSINLRNRHIRKQMSNSPHTLTFSNSDSEAIFDDGIEGGKDDRERPSLSERSEILLANIVRSR
jgi:hypothetical protein